MACGIESKKKIEKLLLRDLKKNSKLSNKEIRDKVKNTVESLMDTQNQVKGNSKTFSKVLNTKLTKILKKLYPEIKLDYTTNSSDFVDANGNVMNQEQVDNTVNVGLKVVEALNDLGTAKPSKHGGSSQPVLATIRIKNKAGIAKKLMAKGVSKEQIDFMFEFMKQNDIGEISSKSLAERVMSGLMQNVEVTIQDDRNTVLEHFDDARTSLMDIMHNDPTTPTEWLNQELAKLDKEEAEAIRNYKPKRSSAYEHLTAPGGTNYKEIEIATPNVDAALKGHAEFATDKGIGWYRVDDVGNQNNTLRVLEMQSDMFQKMKSKDLSEGFTQTNAPYVTEDGSYGYNKITKAINLNKAFHQILNTNNKWVKFFIQSIVQNAQKNGYKKIRFPAGETAAKVEGHNTVSEKIEQISNRINSIENELRDIDKDTRTREEYLNDLINTETERLETVINNASGPRLRIKGSKKQLESIKTDPSEYFRRELKAFDNNNSELRMELTKLRKEKQEMKTEGIEKLAPIEGFYQVRVRNTLDKTYGKENIKEVTDDYGNTWFELALDESRETNTIMLQKQGNSIKGQADIKAKTVLINSLLQSQDTLPHEYAHHYIAWFRDAPIVKEAIKKWGSEEALVQAIGEQVVKQKGEAFNWWQKFGNFIKKLFNKLNNSDKEELKNTLTNSFLQRKDLNKNNSAIISDKIPDKVLKELENDPAFKPC
jgi:molybdopterin converting factor small subunit